VAGITAMFSIVGTPQAAHYPFFLIFGVLCGCGIAVFSVGVPAVSYWYPQRKQGTALAVYGGLGNLAPGMFALLLPFLVVTLGFTWSYVLWLAALLAMTGLVFTRMQDAPYFQYKAMGMDIDPEALLLACGEELVPSGKAMDSIRKAGADWRTWVLTFLYFITFGGFIALTVWLPTFWSEFFKLSLVQAGLLTAAFSLSTSILRVFGGIASDKIGGLLIAQLSFVVVAAGALVIFSGGASMAAAFAGQMLLALGMGVANAAVFKLVPRFTPKAVGGAAGIIGGLGAFGGFALPPIMGIFVRTSGPVGYSQGFAVFLGLALAGLVFLMILKKYPETKLP
jgi:NNP family nitrate/nitrite transporter-like MFS transporter